MNGKGLELTPVTSGLGYNLGAESSVEFLERKFGTHCMLPSQLSSPHQLPAEYKLLLALLEDALRSIINNCGETKGRRWRQAREDWNWLMRDGGTACSSDVICDLFSINVQALRERVKVVVAEETKVDLTRRAPTIVASPIRMKNKRIRGRSRLTRLGNALQVA